MGAGARRVTRALHDGTRLARIFHRLALLAALLLLAFASPTAAQGDYVGDEVCAGCHAELVQAYATTVHGRALRPGNALGERAARGCEACHGPGREHLRGAGRGDAAAPDWIPFGSTDAAEVHRENEACRDCHAGSTQRLWPGSPHDAQDVGCVRCHEVMRPVSPRHLLSRKDQTTLCSECHPLPRAQQLRNRHMPTRPGVAGAGGEGFMDCGSCHDPHGTIADALISANTVNESCYACHAEKRGPFLWEHSPVAESCLNCHEPHGSIRPGMLKLPGSRLCQTCHIESLHPSQNRAAGDRFVVGQNCGHCHSRIHGSRAAS